MLKDRMIKLVTMVCAVFMLLSGCGSNHENELKAPAAEWECRGKDYNEIVDLFQNAGFQNIKTEAQADLVLGLLTKDGEVESVSIAGVNNFKRDTWFSKDAEIVILYHTFADNGTENDLETAPTEPEEETAYTKLSDEQFILLTNAIAKSFYSFTLTQEDYDLLEKEQQCMECLTQICDYAYKNHFQLDPDYQIAFSKRYELIEKHPCYEALKKNFMVEAYRDSAKGEWVHEIHSYSLKPADVVEYDGVLYLDAEGYLNIGTEVFWEEEGQFKKVGKIIDIAYGKKIDDTFYGYALNVEFYDDPDSSGWTDGEVFLTMNKKLGGKAIYYVSALDVNRNVIKEYIDYSNSVVWKPLNKDNCKKGLEVYYGIGSTKTFIFTIVDVDVEKDTLIVRYSGGAEEKKSYSALLGLGYLYVQ